MPERPLLLSSARSGVLVLHNTPSPWFRRVAVAFGVVAILVGAADVLGRVSAMSFGNSLAFVAFAPAAALENPVLFGVQSTSSTLTTPDVGEILPRRIRVPSLAIDAVVERVGRKENGDMATPSSFATVGWYSPGAKPGGPGNAVFAGHLNNALGLSGVFEDLGDIKVGASVEVVGDRGSTLSYVVTEVAEYPAEGASLEHIFSREGPSQIVLITCEGEWDQSARSFDKRLVVVARLSSL